MVRMNYGLKEIPTVPPDIIDEETSSDVTVREGENATLVCRAKGHPVPRIIWKREDGDHLQFKSGPREIVRDKFNERRKQIEVLWLPFMAERIKLAFLVLDINAGCHFTFAKERASSHLWQRARHGVNEKK
ncbi:hypothetical protein RUM44_005096 [Polyplax serrata]|uniref:Ig-like domain-containing protein n=1 Tax=Polyplax serrata TaxID=468196 RepID=A0ABR1AE16_POLSC